MLGTEWVGSGKVQTAGESSFSGTFAAVSGTHGLCGCQLLLHSQQRRLSRNCHKGQSSIFCGKGGLRRFTSIVNLILQASVHAVLPLCFVAWRAHAAPDLAP